MVNQTYQTEFSSAFRNWGLRDLLEAHETFTLSPHSSHLPRQFNNRRVGRGPAMVDDRSIGQCRSEVQYRGPSCVSAPTKAVSDRVAFSCGFLIGGTVLAR